MSVRAVAADGGRVPGRVVRSGGADRVGDVMTTCDCCTASVPVVVSAHLALCDGCVRDLYGDPATYGHHDVTAIPERHRYNLGRAFIRWCSAYDVQVPIPRHCATDDSCPTVAELVDRLDADTLTRATHIRADRRLT